VHRATLPNGLQIVLKENHSSPLATVVVTYRVGSRNDAPGRTGSAHLLEHMLFNGTNAHPGREGITHALQRLGAQWDADTDFDRTEYYETVPIEALPDALVLEAERMRSMVFVPEELNIERKAVLNELERDANDPGSVLDNAVRAAAIVSHPCHYPILGLRADVEHASADQLRGYYDQYYQPDNATVVVVGDFHADEILRRIRGAFGSLAGGHSFPPVEGDEPPQHGERRVLLRRPGERAIVELAWRCPGIRSPDYSAVSVLMDTLDASGGSLEKAIVDAGLATAASAEYSASLDPNLCSLTAEVRPGIPLERVEAAIRNVVTKARLEPVDEAALRRTKMRRTLGMLLGQDGASAQAFALAASSALADDTKAPSKTSRIQGVAATDILRVANRYLGESSLTTGWYVPEGEAGPAAGEPIRGPRQVHHAGGAGRSTLSARDGLSFRQAPEMQIEPSPRLAQRPASHPVTREAILGNGLRVVVVENHSVPIFVVSGAVLAGSIHELPSEMDLADVTSSMLERGTALHTKQEVVDRLADVGAVVSIGAECEEDDISCLIDSDEYVPFQASGAKQSFPIALDLLAEELMQPAFGAGEFAREIREDVAAALESDDSTAARGFRTLMQLLYAPEHPYYCPAPGSELRSLKRMTLENVRQWYRTYYGPDRTMLAVVGDVNATEVLKAIEARFGRWTRVGGPAVKLPAGGRASQPEDRTVHVRGRPNVDILIGAPGALSEADPEFAAAMIANYVLGGDDRGLLYRHVREELGLTYDISSTLTGLHVAGPWVISLTTGPSTTSQALQATRSVVQGWYDKGIDAGTLMRAQRSLAFDFDSNLGTDSGLASALLGFEISGVPVDSVWRYSSEIRATSLAAVNAAIRRYFNPDRLATAVCGDVPEDRAGGVHAPPRKAVGGGVP
jgi:zinc protease